MRILCLANSFKEGGRCLAGIQLDENNRPVMNGSRPVWIRPTCNTEHGQVPTYLCSNISTLDIFEIGNPEINGTGYQSENTSFNQNTLRVIGSVNKNILDNLCDNNSLRIIFGNRGKAVPEDTIQGINHSLMLVKTSDFQIIEREYEDREYPQVRLTFRYHGYLYDLPVTDPVFLNQYERNSEILEDVEEIFVVLSLGVPFNDWYYKLVAAIIY